ncbi:MAG TPA: CPBP family intramembrane glutamic endopeptidase [Candidatus Acidoferrales bacterium]|nr:CPBP family intramembrane glutamic endopeptidase [Candidatus Acidoferrales bacterium]
MLRDYLCRTGLQAGLMLACALPLVLMAAWRSRPRRWGLLLFVASLVVLDIALDEIPRLGVFRHLHWSWQESILSTAWPFLLAALVPGITLGSIGVTSRFRPGWLKPSCAAGFLALAVPAVFFVLGARKRLDAGSWVFLAIMPGLAEELVFRGVFQSLLNRVFGKPWRLANTEFGWGLVITSVLFAGANGLISVDPQLHARIVPLAAIPAFLMSLVSGWIRERSDSVWPSVVGHNLSNLVIPLASLFS